MAPLPRRASIWRLDALLAPKRSTDDETLAHYDELVRDTLACVATCTPSQRHPHGGWAISLDVLRWFVALAAEQRASERLLAATLRDANMRRAFRDDAYDFERAHFEHFLRSAGDEQRVAVAAAQARE